MRPITKRHKPNIITVLTGDTEDIIDVSSLEDLRDKVGQNEKVTNDEKDEEETEPIKLEPELKTESKLESEQETVKEEIKSKKKKIKKTRTVVTDRNLTNDDIDNEDEKTFSPEEVEFVTEMNQWLLETDLGLEAGPITKGDGNCWFRALSEQVNIHNLPDMPRNHRSLRLEVCDHVKNLPEKVLEDIIQVSFDGKRKKLTDLICRQRFADQWIDDHGIMNLTTAAYLSRDIMIYSYPTTPSGKYGITKIPSSDDESLPPLTVFYSEKHYQTLQKRTASDPSSDDTKKDPYNRDESVKCDNL